jgi:hypothetical protein
MKNITATSQIRLYEYMFQMWRIDPYALCIRILNHIWNMCSYNRIWEIAVNTKSAMANPNRLEGHIFEKSSFWGPKFGLFLKI